jgi:predicted nucleotidyltransferase
MTKPAPRFGSHTLPESLVQDLKAVALGVSPGAEIVLFGSRARGDARPESDYDLLILARDPITPFQRETLDNALYEIELRHGIVIAAIVFDRAHWETTQYHVTPLHQHIDREGIVL